MASRLTWSEPPEWARPGGATRQDLAVNLREGRTARLLRSGHAVRADRQTPWGNPFRLADARDRGARRRVIEQYRADLWRRVCHGLVTLEGLAGLSGKKLACWCAPQACHAGVLAAAAAWAARESRSATSGTTRSTNDRSLTGS